MGEGEELRPAESGCWQPSSKRQTLTAKSTMQAELIAAAAASDEATWYHQLQTEHPVPFGLSESETPAPVPIFIDNENALRTANHPSNSPTNRHIMLREFRIRDSSEAKLVRAFFTPSALNAADHFSKLLSRDPFLRAKYLLGVSGNYSLATSNYTVAPDTLPHYHTTTRPRTCIS